MYLNYKIKKLINYLIKINTNYYNKNNIIIICDLLNLIYFFYNNILKSNQTKKKYMIF